MLNYIGFVWKWSWYWKKELLSFSGSIPSKTFGIQVLTTKRIGFVTVVKLTISFLRALARRFTNWGVYWDVAVSKGSRSFSASSILTQLELLLAKTILGVFCIVLGILLEDWEFGLDCLDWIRLQQWLYSLIILLRAIYTC